MFGAANGWKAKSDIEVEIEKWEKDYAINMFTITAAIEMKQITLFLKAVYHVTC